MSYHLSEIPKGCVGELSKVQEELLEVIDAEEQGIRVMVLAELSDLVLAIELYLREQFPGFTLDDLQQMGAVTNRAFETGRRVKEN